MARNTSVISGMLWRIWTDGLAGYDRVDEVVKIGGIVGMGMVIRHIDFFFKLKTKNGVLVADCCKMIFQNDALEDHFE